MRDQSDLHRLCAQETGGVSIAPRVLTHLGPNDAAAQTEVFGPIQSVKPIDEIDAAIRIANNTVFGLSGADRMWRCPWRASSAAAMVPTRPCTRSTHTLTSKLSG